MELEQQFKLTRPGDFGVMGDPIQHSRSPIMQNAALKFWWESQKDTRDGSAPKYHSFHVKKEELRTAFELAKKFQLKGLNITIPHKQAAVDIVNRIDEFSQETQSVNTVLFQDFEVKGYNTDGFGFEMALKNDLLFDPMGKTAFVLGAGSTGKIILKQLALLGIKTIFLWNRTSDRSALIVKELKKNLEILLVEGKEDIQRALSSSDLVVNATSVGLRENDPWPLADLNFSSNQDYFDVIYHRETAFIRDAKKSGAKTASGLGMLLYQGARSFEIWTQSPAPLKIMKKALMESL